MSGLDLVLMTFVLLAVFALLSLAASAARISRNLSSPCMSSTVGSTTQHPEGAIEPGLYRATEEDEESVKADRARLRAELEKEADGG